MKLKELQHMSKEELQRALSDARNELFHHQMRLKAGELKDLAVVGRLKKTIARILTLLKMKKQKK